LPASPPASSISPAIARAAGRHRRRPPTIPSSRRYATGFPPPSTGVVALRGTASPAERDRALTHALSIPGVRRVYSDLEDGRSILETGAAKTGIAHPR
jgi:hypothetical protein